MRQLKITKSITNRESQSLEKYLQEIGKVDLLTNASIKNPILRKSIDTTKTLIYDGKKQEIFLK